MIVGIHHISMIVSSESSVTFYRALGFEETFRKDREYDTVVRMAGYGFELELFIDSTHPQRATNPENIGLRNISLKVDSCEEIMKKFKCRPVQKDWFGVPYCFTTDPDGLPIQFHE